MIQIEEAFSISRYSKKERCTSGVLSTRHLVKIRETRSEEEKPERLTVPTILENFRLSTLR